jgi:LuxR family transcriptional regulator, maltose regulon positive regulatory protein
MVGSFEDAGMMISTSQRQHRKPAAPAARHSGDTPDARSKTTPRLAKLTRPALTSVLARSRLFDILDRCADSQVVWLAGPPGSGKTTLVADYTARRGMNGLWYQIDGGDADIASSFYYLSEAARMHGRRVPLPPFEPNFVGNVETFARTFFRELFQTQAPYLVFDNYQDAMHEPACDDIVRMAMNEVPEGGRIFVLSRIEPPSSFAGLRARGRMTVLGWSDLRLTREECWGVAQVRAVPLADAELDALHSRTQGWVAGLVLLLQGLRSRVPAESSAAGQSRGAPSVIFDYLAEEIFEKFEPRVRDFLLHAAYLPQITTAMALQLGLEASEGHVLREIAAGEFLVTTLQTDPQPIFQLHPLLREFLLSRAELSGGSHDVEVRRRRVAEVLHVHGHIEEAASLYVRNRDWESLTAIIRETAEILLKHGRGQTLQSWIEALPESHDRGDPWITYWLGAARYPFAPREARHLFTEAYRQFSSATPSDAHGAVAALSGLIETMINDPNDFKLLDPWIEASALWAPRLSEILSPELQARIAGGVYVAMALRQPEHPDICFWRARTQQLMHSTTDPNVRVSLLAMTIALGAWVGQFARVGPLLDQMRSALTSPDISSVTATKAAQAESMFYMLAGDRGRCVEASLRGLDLVARTGVRIWNDTFLINALCGALAEADVESAAAFLQQIEARPSADRKFDVFLRAYGAAWFAMLQGDAFIAHRHLKLAVHTAAELGLPFFQVIASIGLSQILFDNGDARGAQQELTRAMQVAGRLHNPLLDFTLLMYRAHMALRRGTDSEALGLLREGLELGRERGLMHFPWWQPQKVAELCQRALEADIEPDYVRRLIARRGLMPVHPPYQLRSWPWRFRIEALGGFRLSRPGTGGCGTPKRTSRPLDLLKVLVAHGGEGVKLERAAEALWPHVDNDYAVRSLTTTLHRLRKDLGDDDAVLLNAGELSLNRRFFWSDTWAFEQAREAALTLAAACGTSEQLPAVVSAVRAALGYCRGTLLADDADAAWAVAPRERFRSHLMRLLTTVGAVLEKHGLIEELLDMYRHALESDPLNEALYRRLMLSLKNAARPHEASEAYQRCRAILKAERRTEPSAATQELHRSLYPVGA